MKDYVKVMSLTAVYKLHSCNPEDDLKLGY